MSSPLRNFTSPIQDFLVTVLVFKPHIFSREVLSRSILASLKK